MKDKLGTEKEITSKNSSTLSFSNCKEGVSNFNEFSGMSRQVLIPKDFKLFLKLQKM
jgi:prefoldin subunit 5